jgi:hypothetical protein
VVSTDPDRRLGPIGAGPFVLGPSEAVLLGRL